MIENFKNKLDALSDGAMVVLLALCEAVHQCTKGEFGFMDEAYAILEDTTISKHAFAGFVSALTDDFIDWSEDLGADPGIVSDGVQFAVVPEAYEMRQQIRTRVEML